MWPDDEHHPLPYDVELRPSPEFAYESSLNKLLYLPLAAERENTVQFLVPADSTMYDEDMPPEELGLTRQQGKLLQISTWLDLDNRISIGCAGAIICYLQRKRSAAYLPDDPSANMVFRIAQLEMFNLRGTM